MSAPSSPRITVIIATYHRPRVLPYAIGSVLRQTLTDFELLVVGDGCTDNSERVVRRLEDPRVRWINLAVNTGHQSGPNNEGLRQARGEIVAYLGHDDLWLPHHLASLVRALDATPADLAYGVIARIGPEARFVWASLPNPRAGLWASPSGMVHRRCVTEAIGGWRDYREMTVEPDVELWRRAHAAGYRFAFVPRLTAVRFPAAWRRGVYATDPCHEQAAWLARIDAEPDLEIEELAKMVIDNHEMSRLSYRELVRRFAGETVRRFRIRRARPSTWRALIWRRTGGGIDDLRRFKGL